MDNLNQEQKQRLIEAGQAVVNMSHGIKNIVQSIRSGRDVMNEALNRNNLDVARRTWDILSQNIDRIQTLSLNMLKYSKDDPPHCQPCQFNHLVQTVLDTVQPLADRRGVTLTAALDEHLQTASVDAEKMQDVVMNLLINAIEAVPEKTGHIAVDTECDLETGHLLLRISDNGPGIDDTRVIFEPFHTTKASAGTGLGLTIAQKIIHQHGGTIDVQSRTEEGSIFTVCLPVQFQTD